MWTWIQWNLKPGSEHQGQSWAAGTAFHFGLEAHENELYSQRKCGNPSFFSTFLFLIPQLPSIPIVAAADKQEPKLQRRVPFLFIMELWSQREGWILVLCSLTWPLPWKYALEWGNCREASGNWKEIAEREKLWKTLFEVICEVLHSLLSCAYTDLILNNTPNLLRTQLTNRLLPTLQLDH